MYLSGNGYNYNVTCIFVCFRVAVLLLEGRSPAYYVILMTTTLLVAVRRNDNLFPTVTRINNRFRVRPLDIITTRMFIGVRRSDNTFV